MNVSKVYKVEVTQLKISKPFLKVLVKHIKKDFLSELKSQYTKTRRRDTVKLGELYIACINPTRYERCRAINVNEVEKTATLVFIDCGYQGTLPSNQLRLIDQSSELRNVKPLCKELTLAKISITQTEDYSSKIGRLHDMIIGKVLMMTIIAECLSGILVDLKINNESLITSIIPQCEILSTIISEIPIYKQVQIMEEKRLERERIIESEGFVARTLVESPEARHRSKAFFADAGVDYDVRITTYQDGPFCFYVQFTKNDSDYQRFQCGLQGMKEQFTRVRGASEVGSKAIAFIEGEYRRVVITKISEILGMRQAEVRSLETGAVFLVNISTLLAMPPKIADVYPYARAFKLAGMEKIQFKNVTKKEFNFFFNYITSQKLLKLRFVSDLGSTPTCDLYAGKSNILKECTMWNPHGLKYPPQKPLRTIDYRVRICYIESLKEFYVHLLQTEKSPLQKLRENYKFLDPETLFNPRVGDSCLIELSGTKCRGRVMEWVTSDVFKVEYVDYGYTEDHYENELKVTVDEINNLSPRLAYRCCLDGFENKRRVDDAFSEMFESICRRDRAWTMRVMRIVGDVAIVELRNALDGENIIDLLKKNNRNKNLNNSDWTEEQPSMTGHLEGKETSFDDTMNSTREYWINTEDESDFDEASSQLGNSTLVPNTIGSDWDAEDDDDEDRNAHWSDETCYQDWDANKPNYVDPISCASSSKSFDGQCPYNSGSSSSAREKACSLASSGVSSIPATYHRSLTPMQITNVTSARSFTIQTLESIGEFDAFQKSLQEQAKVQPPLTTFKTGTLVIAFYKLTESWYRGMILDVDEKAGNFLVSVRCSDDGKTFPVDDKSHLKTMSLSMSFAKSFGIQCSLAISRDVMKETEVNKYLTDNRDGNLEYQQNVAVYQKHKIIELFLDGKNVTDKFVKHGWARRQVFVPTEFGYIVWANASTDFGVQMEADSDTLNQVSVYAEQVKPVEVKDPKVGMLVMALNKEDKAWYRAKLVRTIPGKEYEVYFIDYGHSGFVHSITAVEDQAIGDIRPLAFKCSFKLPPGLTSLSVAGENKFKEIANGGKSRLKIVMIEPGDSAAFVDVFNDKEVSIFNMLLSMP